MLVNDRQEHGSGRILPDQGSQIDQLRGPKYFESSRICGWLDPAGTQGFAPQFNNCRVSLREVRYWTTMSHNFDQLR